MTDEEYDLALINRDPFAVGPRRGQISGATTPRGGRDQYQYTPLESYGNLLRAGATGATLNWSDEAEALARSRMPGGRSYEDELKDIRSSYGEWAQRNPVTSLGSELVGGMLPLAALYAAVPATAGAAVPGAAAATARTVGTLSRLKDLFKAREIGRSAAMGGVEGVISGVGGAEGEQDLLNAGLGMGVVGTALGGTMPVIARAAAPAGSRVVDWLRSKLSLPVSQADEAAERLARTAADARLSPAQIGQEVAEGRAANIATVDPRFGALAEQVTGSSTAAQREAEALLRPALDTSLPRMRREVGEHLRAGDYVPELAALKESRGEAANLAYRRAYQDGDIVDDKIQEQLRNPIVLEAWERAAEIARSNAAAAKSTAVNTGERFNPADFFVRAPGDVPDIRTVDYLKRTLDADISAILKKTEPTAAESTRLHDLITVRNNLRDRAKELNPNYRNALDNFSTSRDIEEAFLLGRKEFRNLDVEEIQKMFGKGGLSEPERYAFRTGVARNVYDAMASTPTGGNVAERVFQTVGDIDRFRPLFDGDKFGLFAAAVRREADMVEQAQKVLAAGSAGGARRVLDDPSLAQEISRMATQAVIGSPQSSLVSTAARVAQSSDISDEAATRLTRMLLSDKPTEVAAAVKALENYSARLEARERRQVMAGRFGRRGVIGAAPFAPMPEEVNAEPTE